jgi:hypothetical protein
MPACWLALIFPGKLVPKHCLGEMSDAQIQFLEIDCAQKIPVEK